MSDESQNGTPTGGQEPAPTAGGDAPRVSGDPQQPKVADDPEPRRGDEQDKDAPRADPDAPGRA